MQTKMMTPEVRERLAAKAPNPRVAAIIRSGSLETVVDSDGVAYSRADVIARDLDGSRLVTRAAPTTTPNTPRPIVAPTPSATPSASAKATPTHDTTDLMHELNRAAMSPEERDVVDRLDRCFAALPKSTPATPRTKASNLDTTDLLAELTQGLDLAEHREPEVRREGDTSDLLAELLGGDA